jgi:hypothetical protein
MATRREIEDAILAADGRGDTEEVNFLISMLGSTQEEQPTLLGNNAKVIDEVLTEGPLPWKGANAALMGLAHGALDTSRGLRQIFGGKDTLNELASEEEILDSLYASPQGTAARVGQVGGFFADPVNLALVGAGGLAAKGTIKGASLLSKGLRGSLAATRTPFIRAAQGGLAGAVTGSTTFIDEKAGLTREDMTLMGAAGGGILAPIVDKGVRTFLAKRGAKSVVDKSDMVDNYENLYNLNLIEFRGNKQKAHTQAAKQLGFNWGGAKQLAGEAQREVPTLARNPVQARENLITKPNVYGLSSDEEIKAIKAGVMSADEASKWVKGVKPSIQQKKINQGKKIAAKRAKGDILSGLDRALGSSMTRLRNISPKLAKPLQTFELFTSKQSNDWITEGSKFFDAIENFERVVDKDTYNRFYAKLLTNADEAIIEVAQKPLGRNIVKEYLTIKGILDTIYKQGGELEGLAGFRKGFFPRVPSKDPNRLALITADPELSNVKKQLRMKGKEDDPVEWAKKLNEFAKQRKEPEFAKGSTLGRERILPFVKKEQADAYVPPRAAFDSYINDATHVIGRRKFFTNLGDEKHKVSAIGEVLDVDSLIDSVGKVGVKGKDALEAAQILQARFGPGEVAMGQTASALKDMSHITLLGDIHSTLTQVQDVYASMYKNGVFNAIRGGYQNFTGKGMSKEVVLGLRDHIADFASTAPTKKIADKILTVTGFRAVDKFGKQTFMNSSLLKNQQLARKNPEKFAKKWGEFFGNETEQLMNELKLYKTPDDVTDRIGLMLWDDLSKVQPISLSEMPEAYHRMKNGRLLYALNSFTIKQLDIIRNDVYNSLRKGDYKRAALALAGYGMFFTGASIPVDMMKDHLAGRDPRGLRDLAGEGALKAIGLNKYTFDKLDKPDGLTSAIAGMVTASIAPLAILVNSIYNQKPEELFEFVPVIGRTVKSRSKEKDIFDEIKFSDDLFDTEGLFEDLR